MHSGSPSRELTIDDSPPDSVGWRLPPWIPVGILVLAVAVRVAAVLEPAAVNALSPWREADYLQIARNFLREGMNPFVPRVDWRGATSGAAEMELPVLPWLASLVFHVTGVQVVVLRLLAAACSIGSLFVFRRLAARLLTPTAAAGALLLFAVSPFAVALASAIQPEPLLLLTSLLAGLAIVEWEQDGARAALLRAGLWTAAAILAKASAAHLGIVLAVLVVRRHGVFGWLRRRDVYAAAALALVPPLLWYGWAHATYQQTGLSLGLSNETHGLTAQLLASPWSAIVGNVSVELRDVFVHAGALLALAGLVLSRGRAFVPAVWYGAVVVFYAFSLDTSGDGWATYYHVLSVVPAVLLMGAGCDALLRRGRAAAWLGVGLLVAAAGLASVRSLRLTVARRHQPALARMREACLALAPSLPPGALVAVRGGHRLDAHGHPVAFNESMAFFWLDHRGDNYAVEDASEATLVRLSRAGCAYWLVKPADREDAALAGLAARLPRVATSGEYAIVDLGELR